MIENCLEVVPLASWHKCKDNIKMGIKVGVDIVVYVYLAQRNIQQQADVKTELNLF
jgi:hypothetical protein